MGCAGSTGSGHGRTPLNAIRGRAQAGWPCSSDPARREPVLKRSVWRIPRSVLEDLASALAPALAAAGERGALTLPPRYSTGGAGHAGAGQCLVVTFRLTAAAHPAAALSDRRRRSPTTDLVSASRTRR